MFVSQSLTSQALHPPSSTEPNIGHLGPPVAKKKLSLSLAGANKSRHCGLILGLAVYPTTPAPHTHTHLTKTATISYSQDGK